VRSEDVVYVNAIKYVLRFVQMADANDRNCKSVAITILVVAVEHIYYNPCLSPF
jgi:hypothetical protein